jgi:hypothetical protein
VEGEDDRCGLGGVVLRRGVDEETALLAVGGDGAELEARRDRGAGGLAFGERLVDSPWSLSVWPGGGVWEVCSDFIDCENTVVVGVGGGEACGESWGSSEFGGGEFGVGVGVEAFEDALEALAGRLSVALGERGGGEGERDEGESDGSGRRHGVPPVLVISGGTRGSGVYCVGGVSCS